MGAEYMGSPSDNRGRGNDSSLPLVRAQNKMASQTLLACFVLLVAAVYTSLGAYDGFAQGPVDKGYTMTMQEQEQVAVWKELFKNHRTATEEERDVLLQEALKLKEFAKRFLNLGESMTNTKSIQHLGVPTELVHHIARSGTTQDKSEIHSEELRIENGVIKGNRTVNIFKDGRHMEAMFLEDGTVIEDINVSK